MLEWLTCGKRFELARPQLANHDDTRITPAKPVEAAASYRPLAHLRDVVLKTEDVGRFGIDVFEPYLTRKDRSGHLDMTIRPVGNGCSNACQKGLSFIVAHIDR